MRFALLFSLLVWLGIFLALNWITYFTAWLVLVVFSVLVLGVLFIRAAGRVY
jgi:hypothetical protein